MAGPGGIWVWEHLARELMALNVVYKSAVKVLGSDLLALPFNYFHGIFLSLKHKSEQSRTSRS